MNLQYKEVTTLKLINQHDLIPVEVCYNNFNSTLVSHKKRHKKKAEQIKSISKDKAFEGNDTKLNLPTALSGDWPDQVLNVRTFHRFHLVDPSPWPIMASTSALMVTMGGVMYMHKFLGGWRLLTWGIVYLCFVMYVWWRDVVREATYEGHHNPRVQRGIRLGVALFIVSEAMFFFSFFWAFLHSSLSPVMSIGGCWPPAAISTPSAFGMALTNTVFLLSSGVTITWSHIAIKIRTKRHIIIGLLYTIAFSIFFMLYQNFEYRCATFSISDGIYGSCFYMITGLHGFHVFVGSIAIIVALWRTVLNHFTSTHHVGFESAIWYWHFVDIVWVLVYFLIYLWGNARVSVTLPLLDTC